MQREDLDRLTADHSGCLVAAYADMSSGVTLISGHQQPVGREVLDRLCAEASLRLGGTDTPPFGSATCSVAIKSEGDEVCVFLRDPEDATCVLSLVCNSPDALYSTLNDVLAVFQSNSNGKPA